MQSSDELKHGLQTMRVSLYSARVEQRWRTTRTHKATTARRSHHIHRHDMFAQMSFPAPGPPYLRRHHADAKEILL